MAPPFMVHKDNEAIMNDSGASFAATQGGVAKAMTRVISIPAAAISESPLEKCVSSESAMADNVAASNDFMSSTSTNDHCENHCQISGNETRGLPRANNSTPLQKILSEVADSRGSLQKSYKPVAVLSVGQISSDQNTSTSSFNPETDASSENVSGRWTAAEHEAFLAGLKIYGREWKKVAFCIPTRTSAQIRSHAQKYFSKVSKESQRCTSFPSHMASKRDNVALVHSERSRSSSKLEVMNSIAHDPMAIETRVCNTLASLRERYKQLEVGLERIKRIQSAPDFQASSKIQGNIGNFANKLTPDTLPNSVKAPVGPATAALALEQKSLRQAAQARYDMKISKRQPERKEQTATIGESNNGGCAHVSMCTMPSRGGFDSNEVIALSVLGGNLGRENSSNDIHSQGTDMSQPSSQSFHQGQFLDQKRPAKVRKTSSSEF